MDTTGKCHTKWLLSNLGAYCLLAASIEQELFLDSRLFALSKRAVGNLAECSTGFERGLLLRRTFSPKKAISISRL